MSEKPIQIQRKGQLTPLVIIAGKNLGSPKVNELPAGEKHHVVVKTLVELECIR